MKKFGESLLPLDGMLVHRRLPPSILAGCPNNSPVPIYTARWREHEIMIPPWSFDPETLQWTNPKATLRTKLQLSS